MSITYVRQDERGLAYIDYDSIVEKQTVHGWEMCFEKLYLTLAQTFIT